MNRKQFIILLVLVAVVGAAGLLVRQRSQSSWQSAGQAIGQKLLPNLAVNDIAQITIISGTSQLNLAKHDNLWRVRERGNYPASFANISGLLLKFADLKVAQSQEVGPSQLGRFELLPPGAGANSSTQVELKDQNGKLIATVLLGKKHMTKPGAEGWPDGRYVMVGSEAKSLAVVPDPLENVQAKPEPWLDKEFLHLEKPRSIAVQFAETTNSWKLTRASETNEWQLADAQAGEKLDLTKVAGVTSPFSSASFNDVAVLNASNTPAGTTLTVETFDGFTYIAKIGGNENGNYPASFTIGAQLPTGRVAGTDEKAEDKARLDQEFKARHQQLADKLAREKKYESWVYLLPAYSLDPEIKPRVQLLVEVEKGMPTTPGK